MPAGDIDHLKGWIGRSQSAADVITPRLAAGLNAVLDIDEKLDAGEPAPLGMHWCMAPDIAPMHGLGPDGHPTRGGFLPPVPFPRRMWAGGSLSFHDDFRVGDSVTRRSVIDDVVQKSGRSGDMIFVTVSHHYSTPRGLALTERQDIVYRQQETTPPPASSPASDAPIAGAHQRSVKTNPVQLFRYSAITFNGHRIHYDQPYTTEVEGYPGLIFHGPLQATLLLGLAREIAGVDRQLKSFAFRSIAPLFLGESITLNATDPSPEMSLWLLDQAGRKTMTATATFG